MPIILLKLFKSRLAKEIIGAILIGMLCFFKGVYNTTIKYEAEKQAWESKVTLVQKLLDQETAKKQEVIVKYVDKVRTVTQYIDREPIIHNVYVPQEADGKCIINKGFVTLYNKAVVATDLKDIKDYNVEDNKLPSTVKLSDVAKTTVLNFYSCNETREKLIQLQELVKTYQSYQEGLIE